MRRAGRMRRVTTSQAGTSTPRCVKLPTHRPTRDWRYGSNQYRRLDMDEFCARQQRRVAAMLEAHARRIRARVWAEADARDELDVSTGVAPTAGRRSHASPPVRSQDPGVKICLDAQPRAAILKP